MFLIPVLSLLFACEKENVVETDFLPGKWNLVLTELYENDTLKGSSAHNEITTAYYFYDEVRGDEAGQMYIEEDGEQQTYSYVFDSRAGFLILDGSTLFNVDELNAGRLKLSRNYDQFRSTYEFVRG